MTEKGGDKVNVWFTSDLHLSHAKVAEVRGYESVHDHDAEVFATWREQVQPDDAVWVLGDLTVGNPRQPLAELSYLPGRKHLIAGNHDQVHAVSRRSHAWFHTYLETFGSVQAFARRRVNPAHLGQRVEVLLSHFPYRGDHGPDRYTQYRLRDEGVPILHGHTHAEGVLTWTHRGTPQVHVGWDAWDRLVSLQEVERLVEAGLEGRVLT